MIVGQGDEHQHLTGVAAAHGVSDRVVFTGERHDVAAMLSALDLFVASSAQETFGLSVLEALANGAPALYTTCPALTGIDVAGRAVPVPGTADGIRAALAAEISAGRRERRPVPAIEAEYGIAAVTGRIDDLYERLAGAASRRFRAPAPDRPACPETTVTAAPSAPHQEIPAEAGPRGTPGAGSETSPASQKVGAQ